MVNPVRALKDLVYAAHERFGHVAILVDEYDSPILRAIKEPKRAEALRDAIRDFLSIIKSLDEYIDFAFITGVSSFVKAGLFSGINNLRTITLDEQYAAVCGYTDEEVDHYFFEQITAWAARKIKHIKKSGRILENGIMDITLVKKHHRCTIHFH